MGLAGVARAPGAPTSKDTVNPAWQGECPVTAQMRHLKVTRRTLGRSLSALRGY